jgi:hypothetical protein
MQRRALVVGVFAAVIGMAFAPLAAAEEALVVFTTDVAGSRTVAIGAAPDFPLTDVSASAGTVVASPALTTVTELLAEGANFSVTAQICEPDNYGTPTTADCSVGNANQFVNENGATLPGSSIGVDHSVPTVPTTAPFGSVSSQGTGSNLGAPITLFSVSENPILPAYNGVYLDSTSLTINDLTTPGTWKGYWVVTLQY